MKKLQIILGENEAQITMEFAEQIAAELFKEVTDKMFAKKYGITRFAGECGCCQPPEDVEKISENLLAQASDDTKDDADNEPEKEDKEPETMHDLMDFVDSSLQTMQYKNEVENRIYHLPIDKRAVVLMKCPECNAKFFARASKGEEVSCKCGKILDTNKTFVRGEYGCNKCQNYFIFFADESIDKHNIRCGDCGQPITLKFDESRHMLNNH